MTGRLLIPVFGPYTPDRAKPFYVTTDVRGRDLFVWVNAKRGLVIGPTTYRDGAATEAMLLGLAPPRVKP